MFTPIIGLEIHLQLKTKSKVFCSCSTNEAEPNTNVCPICLGYPGAMPNLNKEAVLQAIRMGFALNCGIARETNWDRKSYMYPDLFKGYQISQLDQPICGEGSIGIIVRDRKNYYSKENYKKNIGIIRAHLEEDTAKSIHEDGSTLLDGNKAGFPLLEVVSAPDMHSADEAVSYAKTIRNLARWFDVCDGNLELGQMRFDANISLALEDHDISKQSFDKWKGIKHTPIVEIKNLNSFSNLESALDFEIKRQKEEYERTHEEYSHGAKETRGWDDKKQETYIQRKKEEANEYRFIPEPDIPTLIISSKELDEIRNSLAKHPNEIRESLKKNDSVPSQALDLMLEEKKFYNIFEKLNKKFPNHSAKIANLITNELSDEILKTENTEALDEALEKIFENLDNEKLNQNTLKQILKEHIPLSNDWEELLKTHTASDTDIDLKSILAKAFKDNEKIVEQIKSGKDSAKMFFVGIVMRETKGKANVDEVKKVIDELLKM